MSVLGLPGNPTSSIGLRVLFLVAVARRSAATRRPARPSEPARLGAPCPRTALDRTTCARARPGDDGLPVATPFGRQDSSPAARCSRAPMAVIVRRPRRQRRRATPAGSFASRRSGRSRTRPGAGAPRVEWPALTEICAPGGVSRRVAVPVRNLVHKARRSAEAGRPSPTPHPVVAVQARQAGGFAPLCHGSSAEPGWLSGAVSP